MSKALRKQLPGTGKTILYKGIGKDEHKKHNLPGKIFYKPKNQDRRFLSLSSPPVIRTHEYRVFLSFCETTAFFLSKLQHNKFVKIGKNIRPGLYIPGYPSKAFYTACDKFTVFDQKLPCTTVLLSLTSACRFKCKYCYQKKDKGSDVPIEKLVKVVRNLQNRGVSFFNIEGGEPFLVYDRLKKICSVIDNRSEIWLNSTGDQMTHDRLRELKALNVTAVMFSLHRPIPSELNAFMGSERAWSTMSRGVELCHEAGIAVAFNVCLNKNDYANGVFEKVMERAKEFGAAMVQFIKPKQAGGFLEHGADYFSNEDLERIKKQINSYNLEGKYKDYPSISAQIIEEDKEMFGCTAGGTDRFYINAKGDVQPCEFLNISFGNILHEEFDHVYERMRKVFETPRNGWPCESYSTEILALFNKNNIRKLPLDEKLSQEIYLNWDRGEPTGIYKHIEKNLGQ